MGVVALLRPTGREHIDAGAQRPLHRLLLGRHLDDVRLARATRDLRRGQTQHVPRLGVRERPPQPQAVTQRLGEPAHPDALDVARRGCVHLGLARRASERRRPGVEVLDTPLGKQVRPHVARHRVHLGQAVADRRAGRESGDSRLRVARLQCPERLQLHVHVAGAPSALRRLDALHQGVEVEVLVDVSLVGHDVVHAEGLESHPVGVLALRDLVLELGLLLLQLLLKLLLSGLVALRATDLAFEDRQLLVQVVPHPLLGHRDRLERLVGHHHEVPVGVARLRGEPLAPIPATHRVGVDREHLRVRVELLDLRGPLREHVPGDRQHRLLHHAEATKFHRARGEGERLAGADDMLEQHCGLVHRAGHRGVLMGPQVLAGRHARVGALRRVVVGAGEQAAEPLVVRGCQRVRALRVRPCPVGERLDDLSGLGGGLLRRLPVSPRRTIFVPPDHLDVVVLLPERRLQQRVERLVGGAPLAVLEVSVAPTAGRRRDLPLAVLVLDRGAGTAARPGHQRLSEVPHHVGADPRGAERQRHLSQRRVTRQHPLQRGHVVGVLPVGLRRGASRRQTRPDVAGQVVRGRDEVAPLARVLVVREHHALAELLRLLRVDAQQPAEVLVGQVLAALSQQRHRVPRVVRALCELTVTVRLSFREQVGLLRGAPTLVVRLVRVLEAEHIEVALVLLEQQGRARTALRDRGLPLDLRRVLALARPLRGGRLGVAGDRTVLLDVRVVDRVEPLPRGDQRGVVVGHVRRLDVAQRRQSVPDLEKVPKLLLLRGGHREVDGQAVLDGLEPQSFLGDALRALLDPGRLAGETHPALTGTAGVALRRAVSRVAQVRVPATAGRDGALGGLAQPITEHRRRVAGRAHRHAVVAAVLDLPEHRVRVVPEVVVDRQLLGGFLAGLLVRGEDAGDWAAVRVRRGARVHP